MHCTSDVLIAFLKDAISGREYSKFVFTKYISAALETIVDVGEAEGLNRSDMSYLTVQDILELRTVEHRSNREILEQRIHERQASYRLTQAIRFPDIILNADDMAVFEQRGAKPNFVTQRKVRAAMVSLIDSSAPVEDLEGKIVVIPNADPGFDYLFSRNVGGYHHRLWWGQLPHGDPRQRVPTACGDRRRTQALRDLGAGPHRGAGLPLWARDSHRGAAADEDHRITQRVRFDPQRNETMDCLDQAWCELLEEWGYRPLPLPNKLRDVEGFLTELPVDGVLLTGGNNLREYGTQDVFPERDALEQQLLTLCERRGLPWSASAEACRGWWFITAENSVSCPTTSHRSMK